jgi:hypothetical protein
LKVVVACEGQLRPAPATLQDSPQLIGACEKARLGNTRVDNTAEPMTKADTVKNIFILYLSVITRFVYFAPTVLFRGEASVERDPTAWLRNI